MTINLSIMKKSFQLMKPVLTDKTVLRLQEATGLPISRGVDKTINTMLDQLESFNGKNPKTTDSKSDETSNDCQCDISEKNKVTDEEKK